MFNFGRLGDVNKTIGIGIAKARLFELIDRVEFGETIIIARNGAPVAQLRPLERELPKDAKRIRGAQRVSKQNKAKPHLAAGRLELSCYSPMILKRFGIAEIRPVCGRNSRR